MEDQYLDRTTIGATGNVQVKTHLDWTEMVKDWLSFFLYGIREQPNTLMMIDELFI